MEIRLDIVANKSADRYVLAVTESRVALTKSMCCTQVSKLIFLY